MPNLSDPSVLMTFVIVAAAVVVLALVVFFFIRRDKSSGENPTGQINSESSSHRRETIRAKHLEEDKMREIYKDLAIMTATLNYQRVLDIALDLSIQALGDSGEPAHRLIGAVLLFANHDAFLID